MNLKMLYIIYFAVGVLAVMPNTTVYMYLKTKFAKTPSELMLEMQIIEMSWLLKPWIAYNSDYMKSWGFKRNKMLIVSSLLCSLQWILSSMCLNTPTLFYLLTLGASTCVSISDVIIDACMLEYINRKKLSNIDKYNQQNDTMSTSNSSTFTYSMTNSMKESIQNNTIIIKYSGRCFGCIVAWCIGMISYDTKYIFFASIVPGSLTAILSTLLYNNTNKKNEIYDDSIESMYLSYQQTIAKKKDSATYHKKEVIHLFIKYYYMNILSGFRTFKDIIVKKKIISFALISMMCAATPNPLYSYIYVYTDYLNMTTLDVQFMCFAKEIGTLIGNVCYIPLTRGKFDNNMKILSLNDIILSVFIILHSFLALSNPFKLQLYSLFLFECCIYAVKSVFTFPLVVYTSQFCPRGLEATSYSVISNIDSFCFSIDSFVLVLLFNIFSFFDSSFSTYHYLSITCAFVACFPSFFVWLYPFFPITNET
ncbi:hypothetical protein EON71_00530 [bacterium]|nr:MAG: hypothetical protein EON71_00530 [bacterium]